MKEDPLLFFQSADQRQNDQKCKDRKQQGDLVVEQLLFIKTANGSDGRNADQKQDRNQKFFIHPFFLHCFCILWPMWENDHTSVHDGFDGTSVPFPLLNENAQRFNDCRQSTRQRPPSAINTVAFDRIKKDSRTWEDHSGYRMFALMHATFSPLIHHLTGPDVSIVHQSSLPLFLRASKKALSYFYHNINFHILQLLFILYFK